MSTYLYGYSSPQLQLFEKRAEVKPRLSWLPKQWLVCYPYYLIVFGVPKDKNKSGKKQELLALADS